jgi:hypothetical protein
MNPPCPTCTHVHDPSWVRAQGRFHATGTVGYRAATPDAPLRATHAEAEADACAAMAGGAA